MYIHLGRDYVLNDRDIIGIFNLETTTITPRGRERIGEFLVEWQDVQRAYGYIAASQEETGGTGGTP